jgi:hypothetical protein
LAISTPLAIFGRNITALLIIGVILLIPGVYGAIIMWLHYARLNICKSILPIVNEKSVRDIQKISTTINKPLVFTRICIRYLISRRYIIGYKLTEYDMLEKISKKDKKLSKNRCPNCGAKLNLKNPEINSCKYCKFEFDKK